MFDNKPIRKRLRSGCCVICANRVLIFLICFLAVSARPAEAAAARYAFRVENWVGGAYFDLQKKAFERCTATTPGANGISVSYSVNPQLQWSVGLSNPAWHFIPGATNNVRIQVGGANGIIEATAVAIEKSVFELRAKDPILLFARLRTAQKMHIVMRGIGLEFSLLGGEEVLSALTQCVLRSTNSYKKLKSGNVIIARPESSSTSANHNEAAALASNIISYARVAKSKKMPNGGEFSNLPFYAAWQSDLITAGVTITEEVLPKEQLADRVIANALQACRGGFFFISLPDAINELPVMRVFASCQTTEATTSSHFLIVQRSKGGYYIFSVIGTGSSFIGIAHRAADDYEARLRAVVMLAINKLD